MASKLNGKKKKVMVVFSLDVRDRLMPNTIANLEAALAKFDQNYSHLVFVGGIFNADKGQTVPAAEQMYEWWKQHYTNTHDYQIVREISSRTTRQNIIGLSPDLLGGRVVAVSERYHLLGIWLLFLLLHHKWVWTIASKFQITTKEKLERLIRLPLYIIDPHGTGQLSRQKIKERGG